MTNLEVLQLAVKVMEAHNETNGYKTFKAVSLNTDDEYIRIDILPQHIRIAQEVSELFNLVFRIEVNSDPLDQRQFNFYIH